MKIKKITVSSLYGEMNFEWEFDDKVNILAGINGSYKTTLLNIIKQITNQEKITYPVASIEAEYTEGIKLTYIRQISDVKNLLANRESNKVVIDKIEKEHPEWVSGNDSTNNIHITVVSYRIEQNGQRLDMVKYEPIKKIDHISTFDVVSGKDKDSVLNAELSKLQEKYAYYLSDLSMQVSNLIKEKENVNRVQLDAINQYRDEFITMINESFKVTGKTLSENESSLSFVNNNGQNIQLANLSAGEKQLLIILLTVLLEKRQEYILILDEPEISMHIDMQYSLINNIQKLNPNIQIIISTHSPAIFGSGWGDKVVYADELLKK